MFISRQDVTWKKSDESDLEWTMHCKLNCNLYCAYLKNKYKISITKYTKCVNYMNKCTYATFFVNNTYILKNFIKFLIYYQFSFINIHSGYNIHLLFKMFSSWTRVYVRLISDNNANISKFAVSHNVF